MKSGFVVLFILLCSLLSINEGYGQDTLAHKNDFSYGIKANAYIAGIKLEPIVGTDYSLYFQYKFVGIMGAYSKIIDLGSDPYSATLLNGFNVGLILKFPEFKENNSIFIYVDEW